MLDCYTAFSLSARHIVLIVFGVVVTKQCYQIGVVGLVGCKVELAATLTAFLYATIDKVLKKFPRILPINGNQISIIRNIILVIIDCTILRQELFIRQIVEAGIHMWRIDFILRNSFFSSIHIFNNCLSDADAADLRTVPCYFKFVPLSVQSILNFIVRKINILRWLCKDGSSIERIRISIFIMIDKMLPSTCCNKVVTACVSSKRTIKCSFLISRR